MRKSMIRGFVIAAIGIGSSANALADDEPGKRCTDATLHGTYGIQAQGTRPSSPGGPIESVIGVGVRRYDGQGGFTQVTNFKGSITGYAPDVASAGTYHVNEDCSAIVEFSPVPGVLIQEKVVIVDNGHELRTIGVLPPPVMVTGVHIRI